MLIAVRVRVAAFVYFRVSFFCIKAQHRQYHVHTIHSACHGDGDRCCHPRSDRHQLAGGPLKSAAAFSASHEKVTRHPHICTVEKTARYPSHP